ncbi:MAG: phospho-sugar mutase [Clostridia bacterium]|nr:phospho-sugar mutase [Clostridia bacterium]
MDNNSSKNYLAKYYTWLQHNELDEELLRELTGIKEQLAPSIMEREIEARFYQELEFGTGGLRGIIGAGTNRMNIYTVRKATQGLVNCLKKKLEKKEPEQESGKQDGHYNSGEGEGKEKEKGEGVGEGVAIAYDSRHKSREFALEAALVLAQNGIKAYLFGELTATPILSFAVRELGAAAGIVVTASHNPPEYNGYKVYGDDGGQITDETAKIITGEIALVEDELAIPTMGEREALEVGLLQELGDELVDSYVEKLKGLSLNPKLVKEKGAAIKIIYSPLHGTGQKPVLRALGELGFQQVMVVPEQALPDGNFPTVAYPNPEEKEAFKLAIALGEKEGADVLLATDPDADRLGVAVKNHRDEYIILTGNQLGALFLEYILSQREEQGSLPANGVVIKTIVTSEIGRAVATAYGLETVDTLTGFKYIGEKIKEFYQQGNKTFIFGYEESYGYLIGDFVRDKDAVQACQLAAEMALYYHLKGMTLFEKLQDVFATYGFYQDELVSFTLKGKEGQERISEIMDSFRREGLAEVAGEKIKAMEDYLTGRIGQLQTSLPRANVIKFILEDESWFCIRPSGTEPKIKIYFSVKDNCQALAQVKLSALKAAVLELLTDVDT